MNRVLRPLTADERELLSLATTETRKFALEISLVAPRGLQRALENLLMDERVRLLDVGPISAMPGKVFRIFMVTPAGEYALELHRNEVAN